MKANCSLKQELHRMLFMQKNTKYGNQQIGQNITVAKC